MTALTHHQILTLPEAAAFLRCSRRHVENLISRGSLRAAKVGRLTRIRRADLETFLKSHALTLSN